VKKHWFAATQPKRMNLETNLLIGNILLSEFYGFTMFGSLNSSFELAAGYRLDG
jgi:hypothetical protein